MRNKIFTAVIAALLIGFCLSVPAEAQKAKMKKIKYSRSFTVNPVALAFNNVQFTYEQRIPKKMNSWSTGLIWNNYNGYYGFELHGSYRWYLNKQIGQKYLPLEGFSVGPAVSLGYFMVEEELTPDPREEGLGITIGAEAAYKIILNKGLTAEPYLCFRYMVLTPDDTFYPSDKYGMFSLGVNVGYSLPKAKKK
jgi:hypothetical protein